MNRIHQLFSNKKQDILSIYFCAGTPRLEQTTEVIRTLAQKGIDMIEIGIPFSDPMADGPVIQAAATQALRNGMTLKNSSPSWPTYAVKYRYLYSDGLPQSHHAIWLRSLLSKLPDLWYRWDDYPRPAV